jgi:hypothetical protein
MVIAKPFGMDKIIIPYNRDPFFYKRIRIERLNFLNFD